MKADDLIAGLVDRGLDEATARGIVQRIPRGTVDKIDSEGAQRLFNAATEIAVFKNDQPVKSIDLPADLDRVARTAEDIGNQRAAASSAATVTKGAGGTDADAKTSAQLAEAATAVKGGTASKAQDTLVKSALAQDSTSSLDSLIGGLGGTAAMESVQKRLQTTDTGEIEAARKALINRYGLLDLSDSKMADLLNQPIAMQVVNESLTKLRGVTGTNGMFYNVPGSNDRVFVPTGTEKALEDNLPGFTDYSRTAKAAIIDSQRRFSGAGGVAQNVYSLFQHTIGVLNPNFDAKKNLPASWDEYNDAETAWAASPALTQKEAMTNFLRIELVKEGKLPPRYNADGSLNSKYDAKAAIPTPTSGLGLTPSAVTPFEQMWMNPETLVDDAWWTPAKRDALTQFQVDAATAHTTDEKVASDLMRAQIYASKKPLLDAYLTQFGQGKELAAIVAVQNPALGAKMASGVELTDDELIAAQAVFQGVNPQDVGIITDSLAKYGKQGTGPKGPTIIQPDREKISQGFQELYRSMFRMEPSPDELNAMVENVAGKYISSQYSHTEFDGQAAMTAAARGTDVYSQLYGNKPKGTNDADYVAGFERAGASLLGGQQASAAAVQAGLRNNDANLTTAVVAAEQGSQNNSSFLENFYRAMGIANEMT